MPITPFNNKPESSRDLTILIMTSISFDIISAVVPDSKIILWIPASAAAAAAAVNPKGIITLSANGSITVFINRNPVFNNGPRSLPKNHLAVSS